MRTLVILLALLATAKVGAMQWLYRASADDVIINAYRPRALDACSSNARRLDAAAKDGTWPAETPIKLELGRRRGPVYIWQVDQPGWAAQYRNPYLLLTVGGPGAGLRCEYDVVNGTAATAKI